MAYLSYEFFYQIGLSEFGNFGSIEFTEGLSLRDLLTLSMESDEQDGMTQQAQQEEIEVNINENGADRKGTMDVLIQRRDMIAEYFSLVITDDGVLTSIPLLLKHYTPNYGKLPTFIRRLGRNVPLPSSLCYACLKLTPFRVGRLVH